MRERALIAMLLGLFALTDAYAAERPLRVDDLFALEGYGPTTSLTAVVAIAPDSRAVAFMRTRADRTLTRFPIGWNVPTIRGNTDVWVQSGSGESPRNLTHGEVDGTGWWQPEWSPDGRYLAVLSTRKGDSTLWVWSAANGELRQLTSRNVDISRTMAHPLVWLDTRHILCSLLAEGEQGEHVRYATSTPRSATAGWADKVAGKVTASALASGVPAAIDARPQGDLMSIDAATGAARVVVAGNVRDFEVAPTGKASAIAFFRPTRPFEFDPAAILNQSTAVETCALEVVDAQGRSLLPRAVAVADAVPRSVRWAPDGRRLAFLAYGERRDQPQKLGRLDLARGTLEWLASGDLNALPVQRNSSLEQPGMEWTMRGDLVVSAVSAGATPRRDWWLIRRDGTRRLLTEKLRNVPRQLQPDPRHPAALLGVADGELWRLDVDSGSVRNLAEKLATPVLRLVVPTDVAAARRAGKVDRLIIETRASSGPGREYAAVNLADEAPLPLPKPDSDALLAAYSAGGGTAIFSARNRNGTFIWRYSPSAGRTEALLSTGTFLRDLALGELRRIEYRSLDEQLLTAWVLLPPDYQEGRRYPLLTWPYGGLVQGAEPPIETRIEAAPQVNMHVLAAQGYAVLFPSVPTGRLGTARDPMLALPRGVLPAVDKAIELGFADGERLLLGGLSYGGYSTYGLITQTDRFKAAVSMAGKADLISGYGMFDVNRRYTSDAHLPHREGSWNPAWAESGQGGMGAPPWEDVARYIRNSPLFGVDRVQTPLLIVYGDLDVVSMEQGEEFFTALYRQGKRAELVRYWGEGHSVETPANVRDLWARVFAWLDEFGDIARDDRGALLWDGARVQSRHGAPARKPGDFLRLERFFEQEAAVASPSQSQ